MINFVTIPKPSEKQTEAGWMNCGISGQSGPRKVKRRKVTKSGKGKSKR